jgi:GNAT superfamily N-acetyltransferase
LNTECEIKPGFIRKLNPATDLLEVADLIELCFKETIDEDGQDYLKYLRQIARQPNPLNLKSDSNLISFSPLKGFVHVTGGKITGNLTMVPFQEDGKLIYLVANVAVDPEYRRHGIATALTERALAYASANEAFSIWLQVRDDNQAAINLYLRMGFVEQTRRTTYTRRSKKVMVIELPSDVHVKRVERKLWKKYKALLLKTYPTEIRWNIGLRESYFKPGFFAVLRRFFSAIFISAISIYKNNQVIGFAALERTSTFSDNLWVATDEEFDEIVLKSAIKYFVKPGRQTKPFTVNYPFYRSQETFAALDFSRNQTLIWMEEKNLA